MKKKSIGLFLSVLICWTVLGRLVRTIDGDTFDAEFLIWSNIMVQERVRIEGIDTPEMRKPKGVTETPEEKEARLKRANAAKSFTDDWLNGGPFYFYTCGKYTLGRILGRVYRGKEDLAVMLKEDGHEKRP